MQHTANQLQQWAKEPNFGVNSFAHSLLSMSQSICPLYQGVVLDRMCNPSEGFIFHAKSCSGNCINGPRCSYCISKINVKKKIHQSNDFIIKCARKRATISKISMNPDLVAMEIDKAWEENKVKDSQCHENVQEVDEAVKQNYSILDNLLFAQEHLVFKFSSIDVQVKCSETVASVNVTKVTARVITSVIMALVRMSDCCLQGIEPCKCKGKGIN
jgi:hypothetical protein